MSARYLLDVKQLHIVLFDLKYLDIERPTSYDIARAKKLWKGRSTNVMWTNTSFSMYMGQQDAVSTAAFEPARRREVLLGNLADTQCIVATERTARIGLATLAATAFTAGRRLVRG